MCHKIFSIFLDLPVLIGLFAHPLIYKTAVIWCDKYGLALSD